MSNLQVEKKQRQDYYLQLMGIPVWKLERHQQPSTISFTLKKTPRQEKTLIVPAPYVQQEQAPAVKKDVIAPVIEAEAVTPALEPPPPVNIDSVNIDMMPSYVADQVNTPQPDSHSISAYIENSQEMGEEPTLADIKNFHAETALEQQIFQLNQTISSCAQCENRLSPDENISGRFLSVSNDEQQSSLLILVSEPSEQDYKQKKLLTANYLQLFSTMLRAVGVDKRTIYITSLLKCYSRKHQKPSHAERENCFDFLKKELAIINPRVIMTLGAIDLSDIINATEKEEITKEAEKAKVEAKTTLPLSVLRQQNLTVAHSLVKEKTVPVVATFHPAFLYRNALFKKQAFEDLLIIKNLLK